MSYEGYSQFLCKVGHYWAEDCMMADDNSKCSVCFKSAVWENMVNQTNGCEAISGDPNDLSNIHEKAGDCFCGYVPLEEVDKKACDKCGSILEQRFKIPKKGQGRRIKTGSERDEQPYSRQNVKKGRRSRKTRK